MESLLVSGIVIKESIALVDCSELVGCTMVVMTVPDWCSVNGLIVVL